MHHGGSVARGASGSGPRPPFWRAFLVSFALFVLLGELWSLATPLNGGPDERAQTMNAAAVVRGQLLGPRPHGAPAAYKTVRVPAIYTDFGTGDCVVGRPDVPAGTCPAHPVPDRVVDSATYVGRYPPLYYLLVGWPSVLGTRASIYLIRAMSVLVNSFFLAMAVGVVCRWARSIFLLPAVAVAATPMAFFLSGVVNPSGLEISAAVAMWTAAVVFVTDHPEDPPAGLLAVLASAVCAEILVRGDSPLWPLVGVAVLSPLIWRRLDIRRIAARTSARVAAGAVVVAGTGAALWLGVGKPLTTVPQGAAPPGTSGATLVRAIIGNSGTLLLEVIGKFGWIDTPAPYLTYVVWIVAVGTLLSIGLVVGRRREVASVGLALVATLAVPFVLLYVTIRHGSLMQGRYFAALAESVPIIAGASAGRSPFPVPASVRWSTATLAALGLAQFAAAYWALRRYLVGDDGPLLPTARGPGVWVPPIPAWSLDLGFLIACASLAGAAIFLVRRTLPDVVPGPSAER
jgi:hypothetical protein